MNDTLARAIAGIEPIDLRSLDRCAHLQTRKDRKYIVSRDTLASLLEQLPSEVRVLDIDGRRWFGYESVYFDTPLLDSYRQAATHRRHRFKVRTRTYLDSGVTMLEVKTKNRRGKTVKHRRALADESSGDVYGAACSYAARFAETAPYANALEPTLTSRYRRLTLALPSAGVRATVDSQFRCTDASGARTGLADELIVETKTDGAPSVFDRLLWRAGYRPVKISKFATGLAALHPELPSNRWHPVLRAYFGRPPARGAARNAHLARDRRCASEMHLPVRLHPVQASSLSKDKLP